MQAEAPPFPFDFKFVMDDAAARSMWAWAKEATRALALSRRRDRRQAQRERFEQLRALVFGPPEERNVFSPPQAPVTYRLNELALAVEGEDLSWGGYVLPRISKPTSTQLNEPLPTLVVASLRLVHVRVPLLASTVSLDGPPPRWRVVWVRSGTRPAGKTLLGRAIERLVTAMLHFVLGFFGSRKVDARNNP